MINVSVKDDTLLAGIEGSSALYSESEPVTFRGISFGTDVYKVMLTTKAGEDLLGAWVTTSASGDGMILSASLDLSGVDLAAEMDSNTLPAHLWLWNDTERYYVCYVRVAILKAPEAPA